MSDVARLDRDKVRIAFGRRLRELRQAKGWTLKELGESAEMLPTAVARLEYGERVPSLDTLLSLCAALGVGLDSFDVSAFAAADASSPRGKKGKTDDSR